ncbi:hypothetical protein [[Clostridium] polysaccharolyticum]|uniref:Uncharacterized protein n=1 Tax=[Clostridium] polysaccharolyticum TaxID=29364 RepID=A0A1I0BAQ5_9FIRM|nr:hypothetical protein [[Clostridium] polysaccharolyticum]SET03176.1 hypothetical protein SAMN04487772_10716 [[Clostridium] polysaccharolyticum]
MFFFVFFSEAAVNFSACQSKGSEVPAVTKDIKESLTENDKPFERLSSDDVASISIYEASLKSDIILLEDEALQMISLLNKLEVCGKAEEEERIGQMVQIKIEKSEGSSVIVKCFYPYVMIDNICYEAEYEPLENINKFVNNIIKR